MNDWNFDMGELYQIHEDKCTRDYVSVGVKQQGLLQQLWGTNPRTCPWSCSPMEATRVDVVTSLLAYQRDLGMSDDADVHRQLRLDVPRSSVYLQRSSGKYVKVVSGQQVYDHCSIPELCTQCVLAPVVEWYMNEGIIAHECRGEASTRRMTVWIENGGKIVCVRKLLGLRDWHGRRLGRVNVEVFACHATDSVVVSLVHDTGDIDEPDDQKKHSRTFEPTHEHAGQTVEANRDTAEHAAARIVGPRHTPVKGDTGRNRTSTRCVDAPSDGVVPKPTTAWWLHHQQSQPGGL